MYLSELTVFCQNLLIFLPFTNLSPMETSASDFSYEDPENWKEHFPQCGGKRQSPIVIYEKKAFPWRYPRIKFRGYDEPFRQYLILKNNGHSVAFDVPPNESNFIPYITGGPLIGKYHAIQTHFHWGSPTSKGSEHQINNQRYDLEMHIVHKNEMYKSFAEAINHEYGLAVIAVFFKSSSFDNVFNPSIQRIFDAVPQVSVYNTSTMINEFITFGSLLGTINREHYYTYQGSLTTPPCSEVVDWIVYPTVIAIPQHSLEKFWSIRDEHNNILHNNFRPLQSIGTRTVRVGKVKRKYIY